ncbi:DUF2505 domain-containing protein [Nocardioides donggukensis]|uniref:DUF2505 domain-containing protein n=1 Tax=Nocardioides donggukensis TaxID=2774019 RepID=A0A927Q0C2_9ACTN|nr:DUF2505 domain-containing protein [Nocardioides donggukensis]MBD8868742.1 DUF2505 domain-containing protein [Nocardioides donggukensis]
MKRLDTEVVYPDATVDRVAAMLADPGFRESVLDRQGVLRRSVTVEPDGAGRTVVLDYAHGVDRVPSFAKRFVGEEIPIRQVESWATESGADIHTTIPGKPGDITGTATLEQRGSDVVQQVRLEITVKLPLVGGKVEDLVAGLLDKALRTENSVGRTWLAAR